MIAASLAVIYFAYGTFFWVREGKRLQTPGYLPPPPSIFGRTFLRFGCRLLAFLGVGPIKVVGRKNCKYYQGRLLVTPNHQFELDFTVVGSAVPFAFRQLASAAEVRGLRGALAAFTGHFAVHVEHGKSQQQGGGQAVVEAAADVLRLPGCRLLYFPQGYLDRENKLNPEDFRTGAVRALQAADSTGAEDLAVLPVGVHYRRTPIGYLARKLSHRHLFGSDKFGANVVIGKPIAFTSLPTDVHAATEVIRQEIARLVEQAKQL